MFRFQFGLFQPSTVDYAKYPLTSGKTMAPSSRIKSFHMAVGMLRYFDAQLHSVENKIHFTWFPEDNRFITRAKKAFPYTPLFWAMFFKVIGCLGSYKNPIMEVSFHVSSCKFMYTHVYVSICLYMLVYACICRYTSVYVCICMYMHVYTCM